MANVAMAGFHPESRGGLTPEMVRKRVLTNNTTGIFKGDCVDQATGGDIIAAASTSAAIYSVQWGGASYIGANGDRLDRVHLPAATLYTSTGVDPGNASYVFCVANTQEQVFNATVNAAIALTDLNLNYLIVLGAGSTTSGFSGHKLDATSRAVTANTGPFRVTDFVLGDAKSDPDAADAKVRCMINMGRREPALLTVGSLGT